MTGTQIGNYKILEKLGEGGMGVVYKGVDVNLDRTVAIKALNAELTGNPELEQRFRAEAKAQANLNHTNLATLYALLIENGRPWMVMEYIEGETFEQMVQRRGPIPGTEAVPIFRQALLGVGYAHRMGIVHRDIKPSNIMLNKQGIVKVMDFGIAKVLGARGMTKTGTQMGTAFYMSPEQVLNRTVDFRSDIYSLGVTLYELLTANVPFKGDSDYQIMTDHVNAPPPLPTKFYPYIQQGLQNAVLKALAKNPDSRFQTVEEFGAALEQPETFGMAVPQPAPAPRAGTVVESAVPPPLPASSAPAVPAGAAVVNPVAAAGAPTPPSVTPIAAGGEGPGPFPPTAPAKTSFWTPERRIAGLGAAIILALIGIWVALRPHVKNAGLPPPSSGVAQLPSSQQSSPPPEDQPSPPAAQNPPAAKTSPPSTQPANTSIPALPPMKSEAPPSSPGPARAAALAVPAGTPITIRLIDNINSIRDRTGQRFEATVDVPVLVRGQLMIARGAGARVVLTNYGPEVMLELVSISINGVNHVVRSNQFEKRGMLRGKPSPVVLIPSDTRIVFTLRTPVL